jgi:hypothetical protein
MDGKQEQPDVQHTEDNEEPVLKYQFTEAIEGFCNFAIYQVRIYFFVNHKSLLLMMCLH